MITILLSALLISAAQANSATGCDIQDLSSRSFNDLGDVGSHVTSRSGSSERSQIVSDVERRLANLHQPECKDKVWPQSKLTASPIRILDPSEKEVLQFNRETKKLEHLRAMTADDAKFPVFNFDKALDGGITFNSEAYSRRGPPAGAAPGARREAPYCAAENRAASEFRNSNKPDLQLNTSDSVMGTLAHESFHNVDQDPSNQIHTHTGACQWHKDEANETRNLVGPEANQIRFARQNLMAALKAAYEAKKGSAERTKALAQVKAWAKEFSDTKISREGNISAAAKLNEIDRIEGGAEYAGVMSNVYGKLGCGASPAQLKAEILKHVSDRYEPSVQTVDQQAYLLGSLSGFLMDEMGQKNWKGLVTKGKSPLSVLTESLKDVPAVAAKPNSVLQASAQIANQLSACEIKTATAVVDSITSKPDDYVLVQMENVPFMTSGFHQVTGAKGEAAISMNSGARGKNFSFSGGNILEVKGVCGGSQARYVAVPRSLVANDGTVKAWTDGKSNFEGRIPAPSTSTQKWNGVPVVCQ